MDLKEKQLPDFSKSFSKSDFQELLLSDQQFMFASQQQQTPLIQPNSLGFSMLDSSASSLLPSQIQTLQPQHQNLDDFVNTNYDFQARVELESPFTDFQPNLESPSVRLYDLDDWIKNLDQVNSKLKKIHQDCNPQVLLTNLGFLEQKIHQLQDIVKSIIREGCVSGGSNELGAKQQLVTANLSSIIIQLMSTAGTLLSSAKGSPPNSLPPLTSNPVVGQMGGSVFGSARSSDMNNSQETGDLNIGGRNVLDCDDNRRKASNPFGPLLNMRISSATGYVEGSINGKFVKEMAPESNFGSERKCLKQLVSIEEPKSIVIEDHDFNGDMKEDEEDGEGENLPPGSYEILQLEEEEILAPHTHFCLICGKGFKRDANLRMHMRGHGDEYKTPAALSRPIKDSNPGPTIIKRYSCPSVGCKRNKDHKKFQPLKTILCVKNHYKRSHCKKSYTCSKCNMKKFSVLADLKTHEKHCGRDKWLCSCGTTFSRKDKLFGHIALFQGHTPAIPLDETKGSGILVRGESSKATRSKGSVGLNTALHVVNSIDFVSGKECFDHSGAQPINFDKCVVHETGNFSLDQIDMANISFLKDDRIHFDDSTAICEHPQVESKVIGGLSSLLSFLSGNFVQEHGGSSSSTGLGSP